MRCGALETEIWPVHVRLVDGGPEAFSCSIWCAHPRASSSSTQFCDGSAPGTVGQFHARVATDFPPVLGAHDIGLRDLIATAALLGPLPEIEVITV